VSRPRGATLESISPFVEGPIDWHRQVSAKPTRTRLVRDPCNGNIERTLHFFCREKEKERQEKEDCYSYAGSVKATGFVVTPAFMFA
jgi:hypothetical protein